MIGFLFKGILRDRSRSVFPFLVVAAGVFLTVTVYCYIRGAQDAVISSNANLVSGHVRVMTRGYAKEADQIPNDLALANLGSLLKDLETRFPNFLWAPRIRFGGLLDIPDEKGETRSQGPVSGTAVDLLNPQSREVERLGLKKALVRGRMPERPKEILISDEFARRLGVSPGEQATLISSTMFGSMAVANFVVSGTVRFGVAAMDRTAMIADLADIQDALDMKDAAGEILGFAADSVYRQKEVDRMAASFNSVKSGQSGDLAPVLVTLADQSGMRAMIGYIDYVTAGIIAIFIFAMSLVLWNAGLLGSIKRYGEIGVRLAIGESKGHLYRSLISESLLIGSLGTVVGTALGLLLSYYLQAHGIDMSSMMKNAAIMIPSVLRAQVEPLAYVIGFVPGLLATIIGTSISGLGIYKRQTAQLFKELET